MWDLWNLGIISLQVCSVKVSHAKKMALHSLNASNALAWPSNAHSVKALTQKEVCVQISDKFLFQCKTGVGRA